MLTIPELKLLRGSHENTGTTGQGCFMNVIAYLNGEEKITDQSECVCFIVRPIAIWLNDYANDEQRKELLPFVLRAIGSRTDDKYEISRRLKLITKFAEDQKNLVCTAAADVTARAAARAAAHAAARAARAAADIDRAANVIARAARAADAANVVANDDCIIKNKIFKLGINLLNDCLPQLENINEDYIKKAIELHELSKV